MSIAASGGLRLAQLAAVLLLAAAAAACAHGASTTVAIEIRHSRFEPARVTVPAGVAVTFTFHNRDPIDHEWIVGDDELHAHHRGGTEPVHAERPTEVTLPALETRTTTVTFHQPGRLQFICHLPAHEAYGMVGEVVVVP